MTVSSLWKALDKVGSGKPVGSKDLVAPSTVALTSTVAGASKRRKTLAVDLSIWICESLTSFGIETQNVNPALYLVFTRTMKLLDLGVNLIFVVEGKRRIRDFSGGKADVFHKRRSGTKFWNACDQVKQMLEKLGVLVVQAKSEGEALCALLSQRGVVDGVISNDGDCLLFGAKVVYAKYSNENLDNGRVMRYDLDQLYTEVDSNDDKDIAESEVGQLQLSRSDLISFALLTGSDLAGSGLAKVGHKKAIRFIRKCQLDHPLSKESASIDELQSWARAATANVPIDAFAKLSCGKCCSRCNHGGTKRNHVKNGCEVCGTEPGEPCYLMTAEDRFRKALRAKALALQPKFDPSQVLSAYMRPNEHQLPMQVLKSSGNLTPTPKLSELMTVIVKGKTLEESQMFVRQAVLRYLSRKELEHHSPTHGVGSPSFRPARERPVPKAIQKKVTKNHVECYQVVWTVKATATDEGGNGIDGFEYVTIEPRDLIKVKYQFLIDNFQATEVKKAKQGDDMKEHRRGFLEQYVFQRSSTIKKNIVMNKKRKYDKQREFVSNWEQRPSKSKKRRNKMGDDIDMLLRYAGKSSRKQHDTEESLPYELPKQTTQSKALLKFHFESPPRTPESKTELTCLMGSFEVVISPVESNRGAFPPKHIFLDTRSQSPRDSMSAPEELTTFKKYSVGNVPPSTPSVKRTPFSLS